MIRMLRTLWLIVLAVLTLLSSAFMCLDFTLLARFRDPLFQPWFLSLGILLSACTAAYCLAELMRSVRHRRPLVMPIVALLLVFAGLATSVLSVAAGAPKRRSADTTIIPELAPDDPRVAKPPVAPR